MMSRNDSIGSGVPVDHALESIIASSERLCDLVAELATIPAPTLHEDSRAARVIELMRSACLRNVRRDGAGNVLGEAAGGPEGDARDALLVSAHLDCAYPEGTAVRVRREGPLLWGPGTGDNCSGLAAMLEVARAVSAPPLGLRRTVIFAATTGEEGLGGLRGMRRLCDDLGDRLTEVVSVDGRLGSVVTRAIAVRRYRVVVRGPGGHSWSDYGRPSANAGLARVIDALEGISVPAVPRTTLNVGVIRGGSAVNAISAEASLDLDLRAESSQSLSALERRVLPCFERAGEGLTVTSELTDDRPSGECPDGCALVRDAARALKRVGVFACEVSGSTEANVPLSRGIQAVAFGSARVSDAHSPDERLEVASLGLGAAALLALVDLRAGAPSS